MATANSKVLEQILSGIEDLKTRIAPVHVNVTQNQSQVQTILRAMEHSPPSTANKASGDDPHKGAFGGSFVAHGWYLSAVATPVTDSEFRKKLRDHQILRLRVAQLEGEPAKTATFYLHPTFPNPKVTVPIVSGVATLEVVAWGAFTVGCRLDKSDRKLELDLSQRGTEAPANWRAR